MTDALLTIRQMRDAFDVTARTLRFYESKGLLDPQRQGQQRLYTRRDQARLKLILRGRRFGFSLEEIRQLLELYNAEGGQEVQLRRAVEAARARLADMERQRAELDEAIAELRTQLEWGARKIADFEQRSAAE